MSVTVTVGPNLSLYPGGNLDPRLPAGRWWVEATLTGDASAGNVKTIVQFFPSTSPANSFCFTLDGYTQHADAEDPTSNQVLIRGWSFNPTGVEMADRRYMLAQLAAAVRGVPGDQYTWLPLFLGYRVDATAAEIEAYWQTNNDTRDYVVTMWGEFWLEQSGEYIGAQQPAGSSGFEASRPVGSQGSMIDVRAGRPPLQVPAVEVAKAAAPFRVYGPDVVPVLPAGTPTNPAPVKTSPSAAQDPYAALRRAYVQTLASIGKRVSTVPGTSVDEINSNFFSLRNSVVQTTSPASQQEQLMRQALEARRARAAEPPVARSYARSGASSSTTNPTPVRTAVPAPVANKTFAAQRFAIQRLNMAALRGGGRSTTTNPTGGNNMRASSTRRDIFENEG